MINYDPTAEDLWKDHYTREDLKVLRRQHATLITKRDAAWSLIELSRAGPNLPTPIYCLFKVAHGNLEWDINLKERELERAAMIWEEQQRVRRMRPRRTIMVDGIRTKLEREMVR